LRLRLETRACLRTTNRKFDPVGAPLARKRARIEVAASASGYHRSKPGRDLSPAAPDVPFAAAWSSLAQARMRAICTPAMWSERLDPRGVQSFCLGQIGCPASGSTANGVNIVSVRFGEAKVFPLASGAIRHYLALRLAARPHPDKGVVGLAPHRPPPHQLVRRAFDFEVVRSSDRAFVAGATPISSRYHASVPAGWRTDHRPISGSTLRPRQACRWDGQDLAASDIPGSCRHHHDHYNFPGYVRSEAFNVAKIGWDKRSAGSLDQNLVTEVL